MLKHHNKYYCFIVERYVFQSQFVKLVWLTFAARIM